MTAPTFVAEHVQIGLHDGHTRSVAQNGQVVVQNGELLLLGHDGTVLDETPVDTVHFGCGGIGGGVTWASFGGRTYSLVVGGGGARLATGLLRVFLGRSGGRKLMAAVETEKRRRSMY